MGNGRLMASNLNVIKDLCEEIEEFFEAFTMDRVWSSDNSKVTVCFTAERIKPKWNLPKKKEPHRY